MVTEAGGLIGNFTGEADYLYQREVMAGNPKVYAQLVPLLAPYSHVITDKPAEAAASPAAAGEMSEGTDATEAFVASATAAPRKAAVRIRKQDISR
jgi:myo-inositol-1(or 4)-monophosphatase